MTEDLIKFIEVSPTAYHAAANFADMLDAKGYKHLNECDEWDIEAGSRYYATRGGSSIIAFNMPEKADYANYQIAAAHSDSPSFKIKTNPEMTVDGHYTCLNVEKYGGMIMAPWFDRPLSVAGRVIVKEKTQSGEKFVSKLVNIDRDLCMIPNIAIHMDREVNSGYSYNAQKDMIPLIGSEMAGGRLEQIITGKSYADSVVGMDLFLYNRQQGCVWGADNEYVSAPRLDDLMCAYSCMRALIDGRISADSVSVCAVFDNEEVGSTTKQGADSTFLRDVMERIAVCSGKSEEARRIAESSSYMLSADNAHAVHPNHTDKADPTNRPYMNKGIVIKHNANQKYTTDAVSDTIFKAVCEKAGVPYQTYVNRSDIAGGSTLGNISNSHVSVNTVDIGLAQLAMHSPYETAGVNDTQYMYEAVKCFFEASIAAESDRSWSINYR